jgi:hypothetical protein
MSRSHFKSPIILASILYVSSIFPVLGSPEEDIIQMLQQGRPYHVVTEEQFNQLGWDLPDGGAAVKAIADAAPGSVFDPRKLEGLSPEVIGYQTKWHEVRYSRYGLDWDVTGLHLIPKEALPGLPTLVFINGGAGNWYEFFVDSLNRPGVGQYLAQKIPVMIVTIPGNYRHGGWTENDLSKRVPAYVLDRDISPDELAIRNAVYTFQLVADGVKKLLETTTTGPIVISGHSTGGEIQFILQGTTFGERLQGKSFGWGTGGPAGLEVMQEFRGIRSADSFPDIWAVRPRPADNYMDGYLGPLNPVWDTSKTRLVMAEEWQALERRRKPYFKQPLQDMEHNSTINILDHISNQIRQTLDNNEFGVESEEVIADLFSTMRSPHTGYSKMIWTTSRLDTGHWNPDNVSESRELLIANEFRQKNLGVPIRVLLFDVPLTHFGYAEQPKQLSGGFLAALKWLYQP